MTDEDLSKMMDSLTRQRDEFDALSKLIVHYNNLPAVVDDDYPEMRHHYESAMKDFVKALRDNGRLT